jgi:putative membrane protein
MNKWLLLSIAMVLIVSAFFVVNVPLKSELAVISSACIILFSIPAIYSLIKSQGVARGLTIFLVLTIYALVVEYIAIKTGVPYSYFSYGDMIGLLIADTVPWTVGFAWAPICLGALYFTQKKRFAIPLAALLMTLLDTVLDPGAVKLGFWTYANPGLYYGVPFVNFMGWLLTGAIGVFILVQLLRAPLTKHASYGYFFILAFWSGVCLWAGLTIPTIIGFALLFWMFVKITYQKK